ncbi:MAG: heavy-metal-associated domain-containing protein [Pirellulales bacterium]|nr:heavy-metal-associated domain-containing protein [Pirellulales bacterium]
MRALCIFSAVLAISTGCNSPSAPQQQPAEQAPFTITSFNLEQAPTVTLKVPDMHCQYSCAPKVYETLVAQLGVKDVKVELETKTATVAIDEAQFDAEATIAALVDHQFTNTTVLE